MTLALFDDPKVGIDTSRAAGKSAVISDCGKYRYVLTRQWDVAKPCVLFVMLNPSTADASKDDPTIRSCVRFAKRWGCGALAVVNLFAYRATDPKEICRVVNSQGQFKAIGPDNDAWIEKALADHKAPGSYVVLAWGVHGGDPEIETRAYWVKEMVRLSCVDARVLGRTRNGHPRHPLYVPQDSPYAIWGKV